MSDLESLHFSEGPETLREMLRAVMFVTLERSTRRVGSMTNNGEDTKGGLCRFTIHAYPYRPTGYQQPLRSDF